MKNSALFDVVYINLDDSVHRRIHMDEQLNRVGVIDAARYAAEKVDGSFGTMTAGEVGCFKSHFNILNKVSRAKPTVVLEDDVVLPDNFILDVNRLLNNNVLDNIDVIFISHCGDLNNLNKLLQLLKIYKAAIRDDGIINRRYLLASQDFYSSGTAGYIVNPKSIDKIRFHLATACANGIRSPIDILYSRLISENKIKAVIAFPYLIHPSPKFKSTIAGRVLSRQVGVSISDLYGMLACFFSQNRSLADFDCLNNDDVLIDNDSELGINEKILLRLYCRYIKNEMMGSAPINLIAEK